MTLCEHEFGWGVKLVALNNTKSGHNGLCHAVCHHLSVFHSANFAGRTMLGQHDIVGLSVRSSSFRQTFIFYILKHFVGNTFSALGFRNQNFQSRFIDKQENAHCTHKVCHTLSVHAAPLLALASYTFASCFLGAPFYWFAR